MRDFWLEISRASTMNSDNLGRSQKMFFEKTSSLAIQKLFSEQQAKNTYKKMF
jgi:hypothetical protein